MKCENKKCNATFKQRGVGVTQKRFCSKKCRAANCRARKVLARKALSVSQIERKLGISNRNVRLAKAQLYKNGTLPRPTDYGPRKTYGNHNQ